MGIHAYGDIGPLISLIAKGTRSSETTPEDIEGLMEFNKRYRDLLEEAPQDWSKNVYEKRFKKKAGWLNKTFAGGYDRYMLPPEGGILSPLGTSYQLPEGEKYWKLRPLLSDDKMKEFKLIAARTYPNDPEAQETFTEDMVNKVFGLPNAKDIRQTRTLNKAEKWLEEQPTVEKLGPPYQTREQAIRRMPPSLRRPYEEYTEEREAKVAKRKSDEAYRDYLKNLSGEKLALEKSKLDETKRFHDLQVRMNETRLEELKAYHNNLNDQAKAMLAFKGFDENVKNRIKILQSKLSEQLRAVISWNEAEARKQRDNNDYLPNFRQLPRVDEEWENLWNAYQSQSLQSSREVAPSGGYGYKDPRNTETNIKPPPFAQSHGDPLQEFKRGF